MDSMKIPNNEFYRFAKETLVSSMTLKFLVSNNFPTISKLLGIKFFSDKIYRYFRGVIADTVRVREENVGSVRCLRFNLHLILLIGFA